MATLNKKERIIDKVTGIEINGRLYKVTKTSENPTHSSDCHECHLNGICSAYDRIPRENVYADNLADELASLCTLFLGLNELFKMED